MSTELLDLPDLPAGLASAARTIVAVPGTGTAPATPYKAPLAPIGALPTWTTSTRPTIAAGQVAIGYNTTIPQLEVGINTGGVTTWTAIGGSTVTVPAYPNLTVTAGNAQNTIAWTDGSNGGSPITVHKLYRSTSAGAETLLGTITTASPYVDVGLTNGQVLYYRLSAVNAAGEGAQSAEVSAMPMLPAVAPVNASLPAISGTAQQGQALSATAGIWAGTATITYAYQWLRSGAAISGATATSYTLASADVGQTLAIRVTATNGAGSVAATSAATATITASTSAPVNSGLPVISGTAQQDQTISVTTGTWLGSPTPTYAYQWLRGGAPISGATASTYQLVLSDVGSTVSCTVTASNSASTASATSLATATVTAAPVVVSTKPRFAYGPANASGTASVFDGFFASATEFTGSANGGKAGAFTSVGNSATYTWLFIPASADASGLVVADASSFHGGFSGATYAGLNSDGDPADPITARQTYTDGTGASWHAYRSNGKSADASYTAS